jgi:hypothetical protein
MGRRRIGTLSAMEQIMQKSTGTGTGLRAYAKRLYIDDYTQAASLFSLSHDIGIKNSEKILYATYFTLNTL